MTLGDELLGKLYSFGLQVFTDGEACVLLKEVTQVVFVHVVPVAQVIQIQLCGKVLVQIPKNFTDSRIDCNRGRP